MTEHRIKKYFVPPPFITTLFSYQDLNKDEKVKITITNFIQKKLIKYFNTKSKKIVNFLNSDKGYHYLYNLINEFLIKHNYQWIHFNFYYYHFKSYAINNLYENV